MEEVLKTIEERMPTEVEDKEEGWSTVDMCKYHGYLPTQANKDRMRIIIKDLEVLGQVECFAERRIERKHRGAYWVPLYRFIGESDALQMPDM